MWLFIVFSYVFLYFCSIHWNFSFFNSCFVYSGFFLSSSWWVWPEVCQFCLPFQRTNSWFYCFFPIVFWISILLISSMIFMISFLLLTLGFVYSFSSSFSWWVKLLIWDFSSFLRKAYVAMYFPIITAFVASHRFFFCLFKATSTAHGGSQAMGAIRAVAAGLHHNHSNSGSEPWLISSFIVVREDTWNNFYTRKFIEFSFVPQYVVNPW